MASRPCVPCRRRRPRTLSDPRVIGAASASPPLSAPRHLPQVDALKALASQLVVWHHLAFYGPMSDHAAPLWPALFSALADHGRLAVAAFLVIGGFLAARGVAPDGRLDPAVSLSRLVIERYLRLAGPLAVVLVIAVVANLVADRWMDHASISSVKGPGQFLVHLLLLQDLLGHEALSAGVWYVAIDFQLYALLVLLLGVSRAVGVRSPGTVAGSLAPAAVALLGISSLLVFNRDPAHDVHALYFFGAYALGAGVAWWAPGTDGRWRLLAMAVVVLMALWIDWRERIAIAGLVALGLTAWVMRPDAAHRAWRAPWLQGLGRISYALFLVHFPVCVLVNAAFTRWAPAEPWVQVGGLVLAWLASLGAALVFHRSVERPMMQWVQQSLGARRAGGGGAIQVQ
jgi:peptidoglycan/LPS O-acetylase OafA/YrhL